jgi:hypothetical protein
VDGLHVAAELAPGVHVGLDHRAFDHPDLGLDVVGHEAVRDRGAELDELLGADRPLPNDDLVLVVRVGAQLVDVGLGAEDLQLVLERLRLVVALGVAPQVVLDLIAEEVAAIGELAHIAAAHDLADEVALAAAQRLGAEVRIIVPHRQELVERLANRALDRLVPSACALHTVRFSSRT